MLRAGPGAPGRDRLPRPAPSAGEGGWGARCPGAGRVRSGAGGAARRADPEARAQGAAAGPGAPAGAALPPWGGRRPSLPGRLARPCAAAAPCLSGFPARKCLLTGKTAAVCCRGWLSLKPIRGAPGDRKLCVRLGGVFSLNERLKKATCQVPASK